MSTRTGRRGGALLDESRGIQSQSSAIVRLMSELEEEFPPAATAHDSDFLRVFVLLHPRCSRAGAKLPTRLVERYVRCRTRVTHRNPYCSVGIYCGIAQENLYREALSTKQFPCRLSANLCSKQSTQGNRHLLHPPSLCQESYRNSRTYLDRLRVGALQDPSRYHRPSSSSPSRGAYVRAFAGFFHCADRMNLLLAARPGNLAARQDYTARCFARIVPRIPAFPVPA
ncbi:hypothetical protein C8R46DRAFT_283699 [Mycena filopes]|nr:hypothetical protein C8R46DRAFT_283699 [Mycena filopes]